MVCASRLSYMALFAWFSILPRLLMALALVGDHGPPAVTHMYVIDDLLERLVQLGERFERCVADRLRIRCQPQVAF